MADRIVIYDQAREISVLVDMDEGRALGPVGVGPNSEAEMGQFLRVMPEAVYNLNSYELRDAWMQFWNGEFAKLYQDQAPADTATVDAGTGPNANGAALAEHVATGTAGEPPAPAPADTDVDAHPSQADQVTEPPAYTGPCYACGGKGTTPLGPNGENVTCNLCHGTGNLPAPAGVS